LVYGHYQQDGTMTENESCFPTANMVGLWRGCKLLEYLKEKRRKQAMRSALKHEYFKKEESGCRNGNF
jgi:hypothetical protein